MMRAQRAEFMESDPRYVYIWVNMLLWFFKADYTARDSAQWFNKPEEVTKKK